ncbi:hypothetical protein Dsin_029652 [Dipteronia sinensis]|uniref:DEAD-box ATP-dependent RNA helicase 50 n=1 Tax=Dipteronia sinensis TaxID=43782 RepID=A0AAE0DVP7_9ROSI|nr:hypothetical protein Dsin_029652 [Dipteronia sinensis]
MVIKSHTLALSLPSPPLRSSNFVHRFLPPKQKQVCYRRQWHRLVSVRCGYNRKPLETSGAYQLVDEETGEKLIVWGGSDDDPLLSPIPPKQLLRSSNWKPHIPVPVATNNDSPPPSTRKSSSSFSRLKAQRVRALVDKTSSTKQHDHMGKKNTIYASQKERRLSAASLSRKLRGTKLTAATGEDMDNSHRVNHISDDQIIADKLHMSDTKRASAASLRGWGDGGSIHNPEYESTNLPTQRWKLNTEKDFFSRKSFKELGCTDYIIESLKQQLFLRPSRIQAMAFAPVIEGKSCILADQSGSGKTLAYLVPLIQRLRQEELQGLSKSLSRSPRVVVMVPTAELASQVLSICRSMSKFGVPFRSMVVTGGFRQRTQLENLQQGIDVLIATPGRFKFLMKEGILQLTNLRCAVLDEVDILYNDEDFEVALQTLISSSPVAAQYLFVTATLPVDVYNKLVEVFPDSEVVMGPGMHRISPGLEEVLVDCSGDNETDKTPEIAFLNKKSALLQLVEGSPVSKTIVFCNKIETCRKVENILKRFDRKEKRVRVLPFHAALEQQSRLVNMKEFTSSESKEECLFLVCTDRASRGIDFAGVDHVVLFDFPRDPSEYVRRVGRTARGAGGKGKAFIFVVGKQVSLARRIMERNLKGHPLHDVPSAFEMMR